MDTAAVSLKILGCIWQKERRKGRDKMFLEIIEKIADEIIKNEDYLTELDREIGDGDHGVNLARGFTEIKNQLANFKTLAVSDVFTKMGMILLTKVGGASGAIYGTAFIK